MLGGIFLYSVRFGTPDLGDPGESGKPYGMYCFSYIISQGRCLTRLNNGSNDDTNDHNGNNSSDDDDDDDDDDHDDDDVSGGNVAHAINMLLKCYGNARII